MTSSIVSAAEKEAVDLGAGITNFFENIGTQLGTVAKTVNAGVTTTSTGTALPSVTTGGTNVLSQIEGAAGDIGNLVADAKAGNISGAVGDAGDLATTGMALLSRWGIIIPGLSTFTSLLTEVEAFI